MGGQNGYPNASGASFPNLSFDMNGSYFFKKNDENYILTESAAQQPALENLSLLDIYLSKGYSVEAHWHPNAAELVYVISGELYVGVLSPITNQVQSYRLKPAQTVYLPMGYWHWEIALTDCAHALAIFDNKLAQVEFGSDVLKRTPPEVFHAIYGIDPRMLTATLAPITGTVVIGSPPNGI